MSDENSIQRRIPLTDIARKSRGKVNVEKSARVISPATKPVAAPVQITTESPPMLETNQRGGRSTSVYFSSADNLAYLVCLGDGRPRASVSAVMSQLLDAFVKAAKVNKQNNQVKLGEVTIFI